MNESPRQPGHTTQPGRPISPASVGTGRPVPGAKSERNPPDKPQAQRARWTVGRAVGGCLLAFVCIVLVFVAIGGVAVYQGLQERNQLTRQEAETHYQRGLEHMQAAAYELAMAEFEHALRLDPTHRQAREALREAKTIAMAQPTATSATLNEALRTILAEAESLVQQQAWATAAERLAQLRDLDPTYEAERVSQLLYEANRNLGEQLLAQGQVAEAHQAFDRALKERPSDSEVSRQYDLASLYLSARAAWGSDWPAAINYLEQLYTLVPDYVDVASLLFQAYDAYGDSLAAQGLWCDAEPQYMQAIMLQPDRAVQDKQADAKRQCETPTPTPTPTLASPITSTLAPATAEGSDAARTDAATDRSSGGAGTILLSRFNPQDRRWEILAVDSGGGSARVVLTDGTQPAVSPDGRLVAYHSELGDSIGIHVADLVTGADTRATGFVEDVTPDWAPDSAKFVFPSRRSGDRRWVVYIGWADGRGDAVTLVDGRTPAWSPDGSQIAYQGTDPQGNNPGLYLVSAGGGPSTRLTDHETDRAPTWSPDGGSIAFMSSRSGRWQLYVVPAGGGMSQPLSPSSGNDGLPAWSPDGRQIAFVSDRDGSWGVYVMPAAGGQANRVADWGENRPDWLIERLSWGR